MLCALLTAGARADLGDKNGVPPLDMLPPALRPEVECLMPTVLRPEVGRLLQRVGEERALTRRGGRPTWILDLQRCIQKQQRRIQSELQRWIQGLRRWILPELQWRIQGLQR